MHPDDDEQDLHSRLADAERRVAELEAALGRERAKAESVRVRLAAKEREVVAIHRSVAWNAVARLRAWKHRWLDPLLGWFGIVWPRRRAAVHGTADDRALVLPARGDRYDVVCLAICEWDDRFQRPQQLMSLFAAAGHRVFFVVQPIREDGPPWTVRRKRENVFEVTLRGDARNRKHATAFESLDALRAELSIGKAAMIIQWPKWWPLARAARERFGWPVVYDCMDLHSGFSTIRRADVADEEALLKEADVVAVSSTVLERRALQHRKDVLLVRNGCDYEHFARTPRASNARPVIGYYGAISDWFDSALVATLAQRRSDWDFLLIGSTFGADISRLARLPNVSLPGEQAYESLPEWLGNVDVAMIPFKHSPLTEAANPVKVYELLAAGKPVVSVPLPEAAALAPLVRLASTADEFERELEAALREDDEHAAEQRRTFASTQTWAQRFETLQLAIATALPDYPVRR